VTREVELIKALPVRVYESVDLELDLATQVQQANKLAQPTTVFLSCAHSDQDVRGADGKGLSTHDYGVFMHDMPADKEWMREMRARLDDAERRGFVLILLSSKSAHSKSVYLNCGTRWLEGDNLGEHME
jgi:hypothetical protein